jgi:hypothetical protein
VETDGSKLVIRDEVKAVLFVNLAKVGVEIVGLPRVGTE